MRGPVPQTVFNARLTKRRSMAFASIPLARVKTVSGAFGGSTANVFLAACTLSLRAWLQRYDVVPDDPLVMQVPMSLPAGDPAEAGKSLTAGQVRVPVQLTDPVQVLTNLHTAAERLNIAHDFDEKIRSHSRSRDNPVAAPALVLRTQGCASTPNWAWLDGAHRVVTCVSRLLQVSRALRTVPAPRSSVCTPLSRWWRAAG